MSEEQINAISGGIVAVILASVVAIGAYNGCMVSYSREQAQWRDAMEFAKRTGGHFENAPSRVIYPDNRVIYLNSVGAFK